MSSIGSTSVTILAADQGYQVICSDESCRDSWNAVAKSVHDTILKVREFFLVNFNVNGTDGKGGMIPIAINWNQNNAQFTCTSGSCMLRFHNNYLSLEVLAHEYTHVVINLLNPLVYEGQSGALNESIADVMGVVFRYSSTGQLTWNISNLRDLSTPANMSQYVNTYKDNGGVHTNSSIPNHAFYQAVTKSEDLDKVTRVWFEAFQRVSVRSTFKEFAQVTVQVAKERYSEDLAVYILQAWTGVNVLSYTVSEQSEILWERAHPTSWLDMVLWNRVRWVPIAVNTVQTFQFS